MNEPILFSKLDTDRILKRAAEIEGSEDPRPLTVEEIRAIAGEAGFGAHAVERALAEAQRAVAAGTHRPPVQKWGVLLTRLSAIRTIPVGIRSEELMRAVRLFHPYRDGPAQVKLEEGQITWRDRKGLRFTVTSGGGVTEVRVFVSKFLLRRGKWMGWVNAAADRLETLVFMMATQDPPAPKYLAHVSEP